MANGIVMTDGCGCNEPENEIVQAASAAVPNVAPGDPAENHVTYTVVAGVAQPTGFWSATDQVWYPMSGPDNEMLSGSAVTPVGVPADATERKLYVNTVTNQVTHWWDPATNTWKPLVGAFPLIIRCDGTTAASSDRFLTANAGSGASSPALGGVLATSRQLWSHTNDGSGCPAELTSPAAPCTDATIPTGAVFLGGLPDGTVGWVRPSRADRPNVRIGTGALTAVLATDNIIQVTGSGSVALPAINPTDLCESRRVTVKRVSNVPTETVRVTAVAGIDGAPGNSVSLRAASTFGALTGEAATFYHDGTVWRVESRY